MIQAGSGSSFGFKARDELRQAFLARIDQFQGDESIQAPLMRPVHDAHPASRDLAEQLVIAENVPGLGRRRRLRFVGQEFAAEANWAQSTGCIGRQ